MPHTPTTRKSWFPHPERDLHDNPFTEAACAGVDPEIFFPGSHDPITPALEVCGGCPIVKTCLTPKRPRPQHDTTKDNRKAAAA